MTVGQKPVTAEELLEIPNDGLRRELVRGEVRTMAPAGNVHGRIAMNISTPLHPHVRTNGLGVVFAAETGFKISDNPDTVRAPDTAFVRQERVEAVGDAEGYWPEAPDLAVEVVSPNDRFFEVEEKVAGWRAAGARMVIVANPHGKTVTVRRSAREAVIPRRGDGRGRRHRPGLDPPRRRRLSLTLAALPGSPGRPLYPQWCVGCGGRASDLLCPPCFESLPWAGSPACERCGLPTAFETPVCGACKNVDFAFETARTPLRYEGVGKEIVHALKYRAYTAAVERLAAPLLAEAVGVERFDAVVPVPLHRARLRRRGFNQAALLARGLAGRINSPVSDTLQVVRSTRDQVELSAAERRRNVAGAFSAAARTRGRLLLVDDVFTTGATTSACAAALLDAGAAEVHAVTLCRTTC